MNLSLALTTLVAAATVALATTFLGLFVAKTMRKSDYFLSFFISLGTGLLVGVTLTEFLPQAFLDSNPIRPSILILLGLLFVMVTEQMISRYFLKNLAPSPGSSEQENKGHEFCVHSHSHTHDTHISLHTACVSVGCVTVCSFFDGLEISTAFYINAEAGFITSLGFLLHSISNGALGVSLGLAGGFSSKKAVGVAFSLGGLLFLGAVVGLIGLSLLNFKTFVLPFSAGIMLYISFTHLIPLALKDKIGSLGFLLGCALAFLSHFLHSH